MRPFTRAFGVFLVGGAAAVAVVAAPADNITPVTGPSTLHHLRLRIEQSSMGWDGEWGGQPQVGPADVNRVDRMDAQGRFVLTGADLYRVSCRPCHKPDGSGAPPEINSLLGPVQAASAQWMTDRMKDAGRPVDAAFIHQLTSQTEADLRKRLKTGGHSMPAFGHLDDPEIVVLRQYLDQLAGVPTRDRRLRVIAEPTDRVGELLVKGTCHICHDATGVNQPVTVLSGVIPALSVMTHDKTAQDFVRKVHDGTPVPLSASGPPSRGRMPVFRYLTDAEITAAYTYLIHYPPK
jgi:mono/diheme cytochrome c family protein